MKAKTLGRISALLWVGLAWFAGALPANAAPLKSAKPVSLGDNTYSITCEANVRWSRNTEKLRAQATEDAQKFCASQGKQMKIVSVTDEKPFFAVDFVKAKVVFKALAADDPELMTASPTASASAAGEKPAAPPEFYSDIVKLDDLHKRGLLTDEEFAAAKARVLNRIK